MPRPHQPVQDEMLDDELVTRAGRGDLQACAKLYDLHARRVFAIVRRLAGDDVQAEDWVQESWMRVFRSLPSFRGEARFTTWLHSVVVNTVHNGKRRSHRHALRFVEDDGIEMAAPADLPVLRLTLAEAIDTLPSGMRHVLVLHDVEGYTHEEIAQMTGISPGTSKSQLFKARAKLRQRLDPALPKLEGERICIT